jgi:flagellar hook protein FlgE
MLSHQKRMDVIGNNISNTNTLGYKANSAFFSEASIQVTRGATTTQPVGFSIGLGSTLNSTETSFVQGAFQRTDISSHLAIGGEGFFTVQNNSGDYFLTRAGDFVVDKDGYLKNPDGQFLMGLAGATAPTTPTAGFAPNKLQIPATIGTEQVVSYTVGSDGAVTVVGDAGTTQVVGYVTISKFSNNNGLQRIGSNLYAFDLAAGTNEYSQAGISGAGTVQSGALELSNVDLAKEFSDMIVTQRGFDANARTITTSDEMLQTITNLKR